MITRLITPETPVHMALRMRPRVADNLAAFGAEPWERSHVPLRELFGNHDTLDRFLDHAAGLPVPDAGSPWSELPVSHLIDHLTQHHRDFFQITLPDIAACFAEWDSLDPDIVEAREDFEAFLNGMRAEAEEEEVLFFPRTLRYDACLRDPTVNPEFNGGSLRLAVAHRRSQTRGLHPDRLRVLTDRLGETRAAQDGNPWAEMVLRRLEDFHAQFEEHERLECDVLYPMAIEMEKTLYNLSIAGVRAGGVPVV